MYNNWLRDYCATAPTRLYGVGLVPLQDIDAAIAEMRRCVDELGFKAVMLRPAAYRDDKKLNHAEYDPFWRAASELGCPIGIHPSPHGDMPNSCRLLGLSEGRTDVTDGLALQQGLTNAFDLQMAVGLFVLGGVCERHPDLQVAFLEGTGGWIVPMLERFDHQFKIFAEPRPEIPTERALCPPVRHQLRPGRSRPGLHRGASRSGQGPLGLRLPPSGRKDPGVVKELREAIEPLAPSDQVEVAGASARRFYRL